MNERKTFYERHQVAIESVDEIPKVAEKRKIGLGLYDPYSFDGNPRALVASIAFFILVGLPTAVIAEVKILGKPGR